MEFTVTTSFVILDGVTELKFPSTEADGVEWNKLLGFATPEDNDRSLQVNSLHLGYLTALALV